MSVQLSFGPAIMYGERIDVAQPGVGPVQFGLMQDVDITFSFTQKELYGQQQFAAAIARGQGKVSGKAKLAQINVLLYADIFFGLPAHQPAGNVSQDEFNTIPNLSPYTVTVALGGQFVEDLGVWMSSSGNHFIRGNVTGTETYSVDQNSGTYTFNAVDAGKTVRISYLYMPASGGWQIPITNQVQGYTPAWRCTVFQKISPTVPGGLQNVSLPWMLQLNACVSNSLSFPTAQDNWTLNAFDFSAFADASGTIGYYNAVSA